MKHAEIIVEAHEQTLHEVDILGGNDHAQSISAQNKDGHCSQGSDDHGLRIVDRRILDLPHVDARHLHTCIEKEYGDSKHYVVELGEVRNEVAVPVHLRLPTRGEINHPAYHKEYDRDNRADDTADLRHFSYPTHSFERDESGYPIDAEHHGDGVIFISGEMCVIHMVHTYESERDGTECKHGGIPYRAFHPLQPDSEETYLVAISLANPSEHTALLIREHGGQLSRYKRHRDKEHHCGENIIESRTDSILSFSRKATQRHHRHNIHYHKSEHTHFGSLLHGGFCLYS